MWSSTIYDGLKVIYIKQKKIRRTVETAANEHTHKHTVSQAQTQLDRMNLCRFACTYSPYLYWRCSRERERKKGSLVIIIMYVTNRKSIWLFGYVAYRRKLGSYRKWCVCCVCVCHVCVWASLWYAVAQTTNWCTLEINVSNRRA